MSSLDDKKFLIRSSGHILGPFFKDEVIDLIKKGKISVFDEVAEPYTIWYYLQDHADFKKIVHSMSMQIKLVNFLSSVGTKISQISKNHNEKTTEMTTEKTLTEAKTKSDSLSLSEKHLAREASIESVKPIESSTSTSTYKSENESEELIREKINLVVNSTWKLIVVLVFLIGSYIIYKEFYKPLQQQKIVERDLRSKGLVFYSAGNFKKALPFFEAAYSKKILTNEEKILLASMLIQEDKISKAVAIKNEILDSPVLQKTNGLLLDILIDYSQKNYTEFKNKTKRFIQNSQNQSAVNIASLNLAFFHLEQGKHDESLNLLEQLVLKNFERDIVSYLKALNLFSQKNLTALETYLTANIGGVDLLNKNTSIKEFKQEFYFLLAYVYMKNGKEQELKFIINKLLNEDPFLYQEYQYSSFMIKKTIFSWLRFSIPCSEIFDFKPNNNLFKALHSFCFSKAKNFKASLNYLNQIKNTKDTNPLFLSLNTYFAMISNKNDNELNDSFSLINYEETKIPLPFILKARFLENQEIWETALSTWEQLILIDPDSLSGKAGIAFSNFQLGNKGIGELYRDKVLHVYPYYIKLLPYKE